MRLNFDRAAPAPARGRNWARRTTVLDAPWPFREGLPAEAEEVVGAQRKIARKRP